jgi:hypothetical protein
MSWATVTLAPNYFSGEDTLAFTATSKISKSWDATNGILTLNAISGQNPTYTDFYNALRTVTYSNSSDHPNTAVRRFQFVANDGTYTSATAYRYFDITPVNDPPSGTSATVTTTEDTAYTFASGDFGFSDTTDSPANSFLAVEITTLPTK